MRLVKTLLTNKMESQYIHSHTTIGINNQRTLDRDVMHRGFRIPLGFCWDGASTPKPFRLVMPKWGSESLAFLTHDFLYSVHAPPDVSRKDADDILYEDLRALGVGMIRSWLVYRTVRTFGGMFFRNGDTRVDPVLHTI